MYSGSLSAVKFCYLSPGEVPEGYEATPVPGLFVLPGLRVSAALGEALIRSNVGLELETGGHEAEAVLVNGVAYVGGTEYVSFSHLSSMPYRGYAWFAAPGALSVEEEVSAVVAGAFGH